MNTGHHPGGPDAAGHDAAFDRRLRQLHAEAIDNVSPRLRFQLRPQPAATRVTATPVRRAWPLAATCAIALVAGGLLLRHPSQTTTPATTAIAPAADMPAGNPPTDNEPGDAYAALDESPDLYLWLASSETATLVTE